MRNAPKVLLLLGSALLCLFPMEAVSAARESLKLWANSVVPALLPFMVMVNLLNAMGAVETVSKAAAPICAKILGLPGESGAAFVFGALGGYPVGAKIVSETGGIKPEEAARAAACCSFCGPMFIIGAAGVGAFGSAYAGALLLVSHWLGILAIAVITKPKTPASPPAALHGERKPPPFGRALSEGVSAAAEAVLRVGGYIVVFGVFAGLLNMLLPSVPAQARAVALGILETTNGVYALTPENTRVSIALAALMISFGGLCVCAQCVGYLSGAGLPAKRFVPIKAAQGAAAALFAYALYPIFAERIAQGAAKAAPAFAAQAAPFAAPRILLFFILAPIAVCAAGLIAKGLAIYRNLR